MAVIGWWLTVIGEQGCGSEERGERKELRGEVPRVKGQASSAGGTAPEWQRDGMPLSLL